VLYRPLDWTIASVAREKKVKKVVIHEAKGWGSMSKLLSPIATTTIPVTHHMIHSLSKLTSRRSCCYPATVQASTGNIVPSGADLLRQCNFPRIRRLEGSKGRRGRHLVQLQIQARPKCFWLGERDTLWDGCPFPIRMQIEIQVPRYDETLQQSFRQADCIGAMTIDQKRVLAVVPFVRFNLLNGDSFAGIDTHHGVQKGEGVATDPGPRIIRLALQVCNKFSTPIGGLIPWRICEGKREETMRALAASEV
jgi:hypothetical protein